MNWINFPILLMLFVEWKIYYYYYYYHHHHHHHHYRHHHHISFMRGIYTFIPETNHVPREYSVSAILTLLFIVSISLVPALALLTFTLALSEVYVHGPIWLFSVVPSLHGFLVCCLCIFWIILKWSQSLVLFLVSLLFLPSTWVVFLLSGPYILKSSRLPFHHISISRDRNIY